MQSPWPPLVFWPGLTPYAEGLQRQDALVTQAFDGTESLVFCEHAPVFTVGTSGGAEEILSAGDIPVAASGRGGKVTYHGPGQRVIYPVLDLGRRGKDVRAHVASLQAWMRASLREIGVETVAADAVGVWVATPTGPCKIAAIGVRVRRWVSFHGMALNVAPDMAAFERIVPCGIRDKGVTSLAEMGLDTTLEEMDRVLLRTFPDYFAEL